MTDDMTYEVQALEEPEKHGWYDSGQKLDPVVSTLPEGMYADSPLVRIRSPNYIEAALTSTHRFASWT